MPDTVIVFTNASDRYDYETTVLSSEEVPYIYRLGMNSRSPFRRVILDNRENGYYAEYQQNRYRSGSYMVLNEAQWEREQADGYIIPRPEERSDASRP